MDGLYAIKPWYTRKLRHVVDAAVARQLSPDVFTLAGVAAAAIAGVCIAHGWWCAALLALAARLAGANLDGAVARAGDVARPWGFVLNEVGDRAADLLVFLGLAVLAAGVAGRTSAAVGLVAAGAVAATLPTFAALAAAGAGGTRRNGGPVGKTERCALVVVATAWPASLTPVCLVIVVGSVVTAAARLVAAHRELTARVAA